MEPISIEEINSINAVKGLLAFSLGGGLASGVSGLFLAGKKVFWISVLIPAEMSFFRSASIGAFSLPLGVMSYVSTALFIHKFGNARLHQIQDVICLGSGVIGFFATSLILQASVKTTIALLALAILFPTIFIGAIPYSE